MGRLCLLPPLPPDPAGGAQTRRWWARNLCRDGAEPGQEAAMGTVAVGTSGDATGRQAAGLSTLFSCLFVSPAVESDWTTASRPSLHAPLGAPGCAGRATASARPRWCCSDAAHSCELSEMRAGRQTARSGVQCSERRQGNLHKPPSKLGTLIASSSDAHVPLRRRHEKSERRWHSYGADKSARKQGGGVPKLLQLLPFQTGAPLGHAAAPEVQH